MPFAIFWFYSHLLFVGLLYIPNILHMGYSDVQ